MFYLGYRPVHRADATVASRSGPGAGVPGVAAGGYLEGSIPGTNPAVTFEAYLRIFKIYSSQTAVSTVISRYIYNYDGLTLRSTSD